MVLLGTADPNSPLHLLRGNKDVLRIIFAIVVKFWIDSINHNALGYIPARFGYRLLKFPEPTGIKINMMPFVMGKRSSLPKDCRAYWDMIVACDVEDHQLGKVGYLTIHESETKEGCSQRRGGLHTECPGSVCMGKGDFKIKVHDVSMGFWEFCTGHFGWYLHGVQCRGLLRSLELSYQKS